MDRILVVASDFPYPPHHGAAVDMWSRILSLKRLGFTLDLIATVRSHPKQEDMDVVRAFVEQLWIVERDRGISAALALTPFQVRSRAALKNVALTEAYDVALLESEYVAPILENVSLKAKVRILRSENAQARYFREMSGSAEGWSERCFYRAEALKFDSYSPQIKSKCDLLWFISDWERADHVRRYPKDSIKAVFLPPDPGVSEMCPYSGEGKGALFIGSLTIPFNLEALEWYIEHVHPRLSKILGYSLTIAGRTGGASVPALDEMVQRYSNISLCADPQELSDLYRCAAVFVNPVLRGAGVKIKTIHALHAGVPVVSTTIGMEGTGLIDGTHLLVADSADDFVRCVAALLQDSALAGRLVHCAQSFLAETYDQERNIRQSLSSVLPVQPCLAR
jgi:polysaccharide biosynthesis protein PslH